VNLESEWKVDQILSHKGHGKQAIFEIKWSTGDIMWLTYLEAEKLVTLQDYFNVLGISDISKLKGAGGTSWNNDNDAAMRILGSVLLNIDDADLKFKVYKKKKSRQFKSSQSEPTHQSITSLNLPPTLQTFTPSSPSSSRHHCSHHCI
jgi:hypothetical protein